MEKSARPALVDRFAAARAALDAAFGASAAPSVVGSAPGRVNLIGEHTDYNDGFVFPMAIPYRVEVAARRRADRTVRVRSRDFDAEVTFSLDGAIPFDRERRWSNYARGVVQVLRDEGVPLPGADLVVRGDVPLGAGLSSSAAFEVATAVALLALADVTLPGARVARLCQRAENEFVGMPCGIMDPFVSALGLRDHALLVDCRTLEHRAVRLSLDGHAIVLTDSTVQHRLADSAYPQRRAACEAAAAALGVRALRDVNEAALAAAAPTLEPTLLRRARHVVGENARVERSVAALERGDLAAFGHEMDASHDSLRDDYEVSCAEVDRLVALARAVPGVLGSRITGGGFGGCTVSLVREDAVAAFVDRVAGPYREATGLTPRIFVTTPAEGAVVERL